jgi:hypothetical protein
MKFIRRLVILLAVLAAIVEGVGLMLPRSVHVERSAVIVAPPGQIFPYMNDLRKFNEWSPWPRHDPQTKYAFTGPERGAGAAMTWQSEKHGAASQHIIASRPDQRVETTFDFGPMGMAWARFSLTPEGAGTRVTWSLDSELPYDPLVRWMGLMLPARIGADYEEGLARLKALVEKGAA